MASQIGAFVRGLPMLDWNVRAKPSNLNLNSYYLQFLKRQTTEKIFFLYAFSKHMKSLLLSPFSLPPSFLFSPRQTPSPPPVLHLLLLLPKTHYNPPTASARSSPHIIWWPSARLSRAFQKPRGWMFICRPLSQTLLRMQNISAIIAATISTGAAEL